MSREIALKLDSSISHAIGDTELKGFEKAFAVAGAMKNLKTLLTKEYMDPIMDLQGSSLGFKTDKDREGGYKENVVKDCLIEAVLRGVQPFGNHFNIIAGNCYLTKEGFGYLLDNTSGLKWKISPQLPRIQGEKAAVNMDISWFTNGGAENKHSLEVAVRVNKGMGTDAVVGKATRKARAWLFNNLNDMEVGDGDIVEIEVEVIDIAKKEVETKSKKAEESITSVLDQAKPTEDKFE